MGTYEKIKVYLLKKVEYWYIVFALLAVMEIMNDGFASFAGFAWVYPCVSIVLVIFAAIYASILYGNWREQCKAYMDHRQDALLNRFDSIERHMQALHEQECQFINQWAQTLQDKIMAEMKIIAESSAGIAEKQLASLEKIWKLIVMKRLAACMRLSVKDLWRRENGRPAMRIPFAGK